MNKLSSFLKRPMPLTVYSIVLSVLNLLLYNIPFFGFVADHCEGSPLFIIASLVVIMLAANALVILLLVRLTRWFGRALICITNILSSAGLYFVVTYNTMLNGTMMSCFYNTRPSEASGFISAGLFLYIFLFGIIPSLYLMLQKVHMGSWRNWFVSLGSMLGVCLIAILINLNNFLWIGKYDTELGGLLMPWSYIVNTCRLVNEHNTANEEAIPLPEGRFTDDTRTAVVLIIGESARADHFQLYGYKRATNPRLSQRTNLHAFPANANYTYTTAAVRCILEPDDTPELYETLPDYLFRMGADVSWRSSNWGEPPLHIDEYLTIEDIAKNHPSANAKFDETLISGLAERIQSSDKNKVLIVLHTSTSHGPCYDSKYPERWRVFSPVAHDVESADKDIPGLINAYDNGMLYTDFLIDSVISSLQSLQGWQCAMLYVSDHGESLGEKNVFMHGVPRSVAPRAQYNIPLLLWLSDNNSFCVNSFSEPVNQTYVFPTVLTLLSMDSPALTPERSLVFRCKDTKNL